VTPTLFSATLSPYSSLFLASGAKRTTLFPNTTLFRSAAQRLPSPGHSDGVLEQGGPTALRGLPAPGRALRLRQRVRTGAGSPRRDRKSTRLNSSHVSISYADCCFTHITSSQVSISHAC